MTTTGCFTGILLCVSALVATSGDSVLSQGNAQASDSGTLAALTVEIHQLRLAVEESTRAQTQTQAIAVYLSVQKDRIFQMASRLDSLHKDVEAAADESRQQAQQLAKLTEASSSGSLDQDMRAAIADQIRDLQHALPRSTAREQGLRNREAEASQTLQAEEARWVELISRLEQVIKR